MYWKIASLAIFAVFCGWTYIEVRIRASKEQKMEESFWERENEANNVRRKPIDHLDYIKVPENLPTHLLSDNIELPGILSTIEFLRKEKILNLTGYTNTELKLKYGAPNITELSKYDANFTSLVTTLQKWADLLMDAGHEEEAISLMEFIISVGGDIGKTYRLLGKYYLKNSMEDKFMELKKTAEGLRSLNTPYIVKSIEELKEQFQV